MWRKLVLFIALWGLAAGCGNAIEESAQLPSYNPSDPTDQEPDDSAQGADEALADPVALRLLEAHPRLEDLLDGFMVKGVVEVVERDTIMSGLFEVVDGAGVEGLVPFLIGPHDDLLMTPPSRPPSSGPVDAKLGPQLNLTEPWQLPEQSVLAFTPGSLAFFGGDGTPLGHLPNNALALGTGSLISWLETNDLDLSFPARTGVKGVDQPCAEVLEPTASAKVETCLVDWAAGEFYPRLLINDEEQVGEEAWIGLFNQSGWSWDEMVDHGVGITGYYRSIQAGPAQDSWLLGWHGECDSVDALLLIDGNLQHVTGPSWESTPSANAVGWVDGNAIYTTENSDVHLCGSGDDETALMARSIDGNLITIWSDSSTDTIDAVALGRAVLAERLER